jgi:hypothetical protein
MPAVLVTNHQPAAPTERFRLGRNDGLYPNDTRPFSNFVGVALLADGPDTHVVLCTGDRVEDGPTQTKQLTPAEAQEYAEAILRHVQRARVEDSTTVVTP